MESAELYQQTIDRTSLGHADEAEQDFGPLPVLLASEGSVQIAGQTIMIDSGSIMLR